jgi:uncharacterized Zn-binding protein involved in type VI secretion
MPGIARVGDLGVGTCCCHSDPTCISMQGTILTGAATVNVNGLGAARVSDIIIGYCGHVGIIITGSGTVNGNGLGMARLGDFFTGCFFGTIITGSTNVNSG